jgi:hypothetical protein
MMTCIVIPLVGTFHLVTYSEVLNVCLNVTLNGCDPCACQFLIHNYPFDILAYRSKFCSCEIVLKRR